MATLQFAFRLDAEVGQKVKEVSERLGISATDASGCLHTLMSNQAVSLFRFA